MRTQPAQTVYLERIIKFLLCNQFFVDTERKERYRGRVMSKNRSIRLRFVYAVQCRRIKENRIIIEQGIANKNEEIIIFPFFFFFFFSIDDN